MAGFEKEYVLAEASLRERLKRDWRLGRHMIRILWMWFTIGRKLRRATENADAGGPRIPLDKLKRGRV